MDRETIKENKYKIISMIIILLLLLLISGIYIIVYEEKCEFESGDGSEENPYQISNVEQLQCINEDLEAHYELGNDIDASDINQWNDGGGFDPIGDNGDGFTGSLDGQGYEIQGLTIDRPEEDSIGLMGFIDNGAIIENVGVVDADITGDSYVGGLVGWNENGLVTESYATGDVTGDRDVGGLVGWNSDGEVIESYATGDVTGEGEVGGLVGWNSDGEVIESYATGDVTGEFLVGGLVGSNSGFVSDSYATGNVDGGDSSVGGLVGFNDGDVSESYATGDVTGEFLVGGLVGNNDGGEVSDSYWDTDSSGIDESAGGTGLETDEMQGEDNELDGFNFEETWVTVEDEYPRLHWEE